MRPPVTDSDLKQLHLDLANLKLAVADKEQQIAEAELEQLIERTTKGNTPARSQPNTTVARASTAYSTPDRVQSTTTGHNTIPAEAHKAPRHYTGLKDYNRNKIYVEDIIILRSISTGTLAPYFRVGQ